MTDVYDLANDLQQESTTTLTSKQTENEDGNITFFADWAKSISQFSADETKGINLIRSQAASVVSELSILTSAGTTFGTVVAWRDSVTGVLEAMQGLLESLLALDRMLVYQMQRAQSFRFYRTLGSLNTLCQEVTAHIDAYQNIFDTTPSEYLDFSYFTQDWSNRLQLAEEQLEQALHNESETVIVTGEWKNAESELATIVLGGEDPTRTELFRTYINTRAQTNSLINRFQSGELELRKILDDQEALIDNIKKSVRFDHLIRKGVSRALELVRDAMRETELANQSCEFDPKTALNALSKALSKADAAYLLLNKTDHGALKKYLNLDQLGPDDPCLKYALDAYLDDVAQLKENFPDTSGLYGAANQYMNVMDEALATGSPINQQAFEASRDAFQSEMDTCCKFIEEAEVLHDHYINGPLSKVLGGPIDALTDIADSGYGLVSASDLILNARILTITDFREFLNAFPAGRLLIIVMECLGQSDKIPSGIVVDIATARTLSDLQKKLEGLTGRVEEMTREWAEKIDNIFRYFAAIDAEIASFISALISLLYYCDGGQSLTTGAAGVTTLGGSREEYLVQENSSLVYNNAAGNTGSALDPVVDPSLPSTLGGTREDECRC